MKGKLARVRFIIALVALSVAAGTGASAEPLSGKGQWQSLSGEAIKGEWAATLIRDGKQVTGTLSLTGSNVLTGGSVVGNINRTNVMLGVMADGASEATFTGKLDGDSVTGEWKCDDVKDHGIWYGTISGGSVHDSATGRD